MVSHKRIKKLLEDAKSALPVHPSAAGEQLPVEAELPKDKLAAGKSGGAKAEGPGKKNLPIHPSDAAQELPKKEELPKDKLAAGADGGVREAAEEEEDAEEKKLREEEEEEKDAKKPPFFAKKKEVEEEDETPAEAKREKEEGEVHEEEEEDKEEKKEIEEAEEILPSDGAPIEFNGQKAADNAKEDGVATEEEEEDDEKKEKNDKLAEEEDEEDKEEEKIDVKEDVEALLVGEKLSPAFKKKAETIFETALRSKLTPAKKRLEEKFDRKIKLAEAKITNKLVEQLDSYLDYVVEEWMKENKVAVEKGLQVDIVESFLTGLRGLFNEHYIDVPEGKTNLIEELANKCERLESELNEELNKSVALKQKLSDQEKKDAIAEASKGLADTQVEKLQTLAKGIAFESKEQFASKLAVIKESYFPKKKVSSSKIGGRLDEAAFEAEEGDELSGSMAAYVNAISRTVKK